MPNVYDTNSAQDGPRHRIIPNFSLGSTIDSEPDGQPSGQANGDGNDDDGVLIPMLVPGSTATFVVNVNDTRADRDGVVSIWIDFKDGNGLVQVITDQAVISGNNNISIPVPATAGTIDDRIYIRVRFGSETGLGSTGAAIDGEVEGYMVRLGVEPTATPQQGPTPSGTETEVPTDEPEATKQPTSEVPSTPATQPPGDGSPGVNVGWVPPVGDVGDPVTLTTSLTNLSGAPFVNVCYEMVIPDGVNILQVNSTAGNIRIEDGRIKFSIASLIPGQVVTISVDTIMGSDIASEIRAIAQLTCDYQGSGSGTFLRVRTLPATGETPLWRSILLVLVALGTMTSVALVAKRRRTKDEENNV